MFLIYIYIYIYYIQHNYVYTYTRVVNCHPARHVVIGLKASSVFCHCPSDRATLVTSDVLKFTMRPTFSWKVQLPRQLPLMIYIYMDPYGSSISFVLSVENSRIEG